jgi:hypothetical protein
MKKESTLMELAEEVKANQNKFTQNVIIAYEELLYAAEYDNPDGFDINAGLAEVMIEGKTYQVQLSLIGNAKSWVEENGVRFSEVVKIHD